MAVLYPPYLEGKLPAQVGDTLRIPYQLNRALGAADLKGITINARIKTISSNEIVTDLVTDFIDNATDNIYYAEFTTPAKLQVGDFYKIQLSFGTSSDYYSSVGIFKYTSQPNVGIKDLNANQTNGVIGNLVGIYENDDTTEKPYYHKFDIYNETELVETSNWMVYVPDEQYTVTTDLLEPHNYSIRYTVRTVNDLVAHSPYYQIHGGYTILPTLPTGKSFASMDPDNGLVQVGFEITEMQRMAGHYRIHRFDGVSWRVMQEMTIDMNLPTGTFIIFEDFTVEQGKTYQYALQQVDKNRNIYSSRAELGEVVYADFEDAFLWDGKRQLKLRFDPKVSSFKTVIQESKMDTIGGQYPSFFRNGRLAYKEFPINGLISYHMDDNGRFLLGEEVREPGSADPRIATPSADINAVRAKPTDLSAENIAAERQFKLKVLDWLNDGKPKLFRSPAEGNYLVRLMNTSLSPNDTLSRMIHSFSANAYEIGPTSLQSLLEHNLITYSTEYVDAGALTVVDVKTNITGSVLLPNASVCRIDALPGTTINLKYSNNDTASIIIGSTGVYQVPILQGNALIQVSSNKTYSVEYVYSEKKDYPIVIDGQQIIAVRSNDVFSQFFWYNVEEVDADSIIFLRVLKKLTQAVSTIDTVTAPIDTILYQDASGQYFAYNANSKNFELIANIDAEYIYSINGEQYDLSGSGRIEYPANTIQAPLSLALGKGLYADIYYRTHSVEVQPYDV